MGFDMAVYLVDRLDVFKLPPACQLVVEEISESGARKHMKEGACAVGDVRSGALTGGMLGLDQVRVEESVSYQIGDTLIFADAVPVDGDGGTPVQRVRLRRANVVKVS